MLESEIENNIQTSDGDCEQQLSELLHSSLLPHISSITKICLREKGFISSLNARGEGRIHLLAGGSHVFFVNSERGGKHTSGETNCKTFYFCKQGILFLLILYNFSAFTTSYQ